MPSRNSKGQFTSNSEMSIPLPGLAGLYKMLIICVLIFPWYVILSNRNFATTLFGYILGSNFAGCPKCEECNCPSLSQSKPIK